ncbi:ABC transporter ATP-binding protein [Cardinium endosymbiont of Culicoides punctatus]|uniref:ABC transporter ATP-binding protein n=1 Tax=Cardinium endosymbiont of Culicoides punctatus TaxID=2304601 RepID=UPI001058B554|nr:ABC transporter ATP-binding protein [Cardinium endosymbiont of Culicoides punctatus]TDG95565.1 Oligopeptide transport ATP-binding protein OppD [Cardinium endosymbiont of Culicoides punctatus]
MKEKILEVRNLVTQFTMGSRMVAAVNNVSFDLFRGHSLGIVGESGSGKSAMALSLMRLITPPIGTTTGQGILLEGKDILQLSPKEMESVRGNRISMIFQEPMTSLNPVYTIGEQIMETIQLHEKASLKEAKMRCLELLTLVGIPAPHQRISEYPHQLSGGMRQRVMIAIALACSPSVLIADEPTTALDVTTQAQIIDLIQKLQKETQMGIILITHDLGVVAEVCDEVAVMYCGRIIEKSSIKEIFDGPRHPYTRALLDAIPPLMGGNRNHTNRLRTIEGIVPALFDLPMGCNFQDRCSRVADRCKSSKPLLEEVAPNHFVECFYPLK